LKARLRACVPWTHPCIAETGAIRLQFTCSSGLICFGPVDIESSPLCCGCPQCYLRHINRCRQLIPKNAQTGLPFILACLCILAKSIGLRSRHRARIDCVALPDASLARERFTCSPPWPLGRTCGQQPRTAGPCWGVLPCHPRCRRKLQTSRRESESHPWSCVTAEPVRSIPAKMPRALE
jgi:hypothetical protein